MGWVFLLVVILICTVPYYIQNKNREEIEERAAAVERKCKEDGQAKYDIIRSNVHIPQAGVSTVTVVEYIGGYLYYYWHYYIWCEDDYFCMFPSSIHGESSVSQTGERTLGQDRYSVTKIHLDKIMFYRQIGEVYTTITGSGGGSSFSPITGFHGKINPIKIQSEVHDERSTQLFYDDGAKDSIIVFKNEDYYALRRVIPHKDYQVVTNKMASLGTADDNTEGRLMQLKDLHDKGLISDEEYENKKDDILKYL